MNVLFGFCYRDADKTVDLLQWINDLGGCRNHDLILIYPPQTNVGEIELIAKDNWRKVHSVRTHDEAPGHPWGANLLFKRGVQYVEHNKLGPFFWLESDAIPLVTGWLDKIEAEYKACGKVFMGYHAMKGQRGQHMNGVGVWSNVSRLASPAVMCPTPTSELEATTCPFVAFDQVAGAMVLQNFHETKLIQFQYKGEEELLKDESLSWLNPDAVLFHTEKTGKLIPLLRKRLPAIVARGVQGDPAPGDLRVCVPHESRTRPVTDLFIKTWPGDYEWMKYAVRSIDKFCSGFRSLVIVTSDDKCPRPEKIGSKVFVVEEGDRGYMHQQICKLNSDHFSDADFILATDADTIFIRPVTPDSYRDRRNRINWMMTPIKEVTPDERSAWPRVMERFIGIMPNFEYMRRHPFMVPRWLLQAFRDFCWFTHRKTVHDYVMCQPGREFSEWNCLGFYAHTFHREAFNFVNTATDPWPELTVRQFWSWGGVEPARRELEVFLSGEWETERCPFMEAMVDGKLLTGNELNIWWQTYPHKESYIRDRGVGGGEVQPMDIAAKEATTDAVPEPQKEPPAVDIHAEQSEVTAGIVAQSCEVPEKKLGRPKGSKNRPKKKRRITPERMVILRQSMAKARLARKLKRAGVLK